MPIAVECEICGKKYRFADHQAGRTVACKECGSSIDIPGGKRRAHDDDDDLQPALPARQSKGGGKRGKKSSGGGSGPLVFVAVGGGVLAVVVIAVVGLLATRGGGQAAPDAAANNAAPPALATPATPPTATPPASPSVPAATPSNAVAAAPSAPAAREVPTAAPKPDVKVPVEPLPAVDWKASADPPAEPPPTAFKGDFSMAIPGRRIDQGSIIYPVTASQFVLLGDNDSEKDGRDLWDLSTGQKTFTLKGQRITGNKMTVSADGRYLAWETGTGVIEVFDIPAKKSLGKLAAGTQKEPFYIAELALVPGDRLVAQANVQHAIKIWQLPGGELKHTIAAGDKFGYPHKTAFSPGGKYLALEEDYLKFSVRVYNLDTGETVGQLPTKRIGATIDLQMIAFSPDGSELACVIDDYGSNSPITQIIIWNMADGAVKQEIHIVPGIRNKLNPDSQAYDLQWSPDGKKFLVHGLALVDRETGKLAYSFDKPGVGQRSARRLLRSDLVASFDGDRMGGKLLPIAVSEEELTRAATVADAGGIAEDLRLPPLTKAKLLGADTPQAPSGWNASPDPAPALAPTVLSAPLPLQTSKGAARSLHIVGGEAPKAFVRVAEGENLSDPKLKFPDVDIRYQDGRIISRSRPRPAVAKENWIDVYDLVQKQAIGKISVPFSADLMSASPDGSRVLVQAHNAKGRLDVYDVATGKHVVGFRPYQSTFEEKDWTLDAAVFLDADHVATVNITSELVVWKIPECRAVYSSPKSTLPTLSPGGKSLAFATPKGVQVCDRRTGAGQGLVALAGDIRALAFHPNGEKLAILLQDKGGAYLYVADLKSGTLGDEIPSPVNVDRLQWCGDNYLLCGQTALLDLAARTVAWSYKQNDGVAAVASPDGRVWYAAPKSPRVPALQLMAVSLPEPKVGQELAKVKLEPQLIAQPGSSVSVKVNLAAAPWAPDLAGKLPKSITDAVEKAGLTATDANLPLKITVNGAHKTGQPFEMSEIGNRQNKITLQDNQYELKLVYTSGSEVLWQNELKISSATSTGIITHVPPNKTAQQVLDEGMANRIAQFCEGVVIPSYVFSKKSVEGLGATTLAGDGPVTGALKK